MALTPYDPFKQIESIRKEFDRLFTHFFSDMNFDFFNSMEVNINETDSEIEVTCSVPGIKNKENIHIDIHHDVLIIHGNLTRKDELKGENLFKQAYYENSFRRDILLPSPVAKEGVRASYKNDLLKIKMPKLPNSISKKIEIEFQ